MSYNNLPLLRKMSNNNSNWKTNAILGKMERHRNDNSDNDEYTKLLLHMDGVDNGTTFTDSSLNPHNVTSLGAVTKTNIKNFGTSSGLFAHNSSNWQESKVLSIPDHEDWNFGSEDFTIDMWLYFTGDMTWAADYVISNYDIYTSQGWVIYARHSSDELRFYYSTTVAPNNNHYVTVPWLAVTHVWYHLAVVRNGTNLMFFVDGIQIGTNQYIGTDTLYNSSSDLLIGGVREGGNLGNSAVDGNIDELRISKGIARWTENFTPPTQPY